MAKTVAVNSPPVAKSLPRSRRAETVSTSALALHLDCSRAYIGKLEAEGVIQRQGDGFPLDQWRVAYLRYLRRERRQSPRSEADADLQRAKSQLIRLRIAEKQRHVIPLEEAVGHMDEVVGLFISRLSEFAARCGGRDLAARRAIDQAVYDLRLEISESALDERDDLVTRFRGVIAWAADLDLLGVVDDLPQLFRQGALLSVLRWILVFALALVFGLGLGFLLGIAMDDGVSASLVTCNQGVPFNVVKVTH